jgi:hypothetical protein
VQHSHIYDERNIMAYKNQKKEKKLINKVPSSTIESVVWDCALFGGIEEVP